MIFNKYLSLILSACFFVFLLMLTSSLISVLFPGIAMMYVNVILIIFFWVISRSFYYYLRSDNTYRNTRKFSSDKKGERYWIKGEKDNKKLFIVIWLIVILALLSISMWLYMLNGGLA